MRILCPAQILCEVTLRSVTAAVDAVILLANYQVNGGSSYVLIIHNLWDCHLLKSGLDSERQL